MNLLATNTITIIVISGYLLIFFIILMLKFIENKRRNQRPLHYLIISAQLLSEINDITENTEGNVVVEDNQIPLSYILKERLEKDDLDPSTLSEHELMISCRYWSKNTARNEHGYILKCAVNPTSSCKECKCWEK